FAVPIAAVCCAMPSLFAQDGWKADSDLVKRLTGSRPGINYDESKVPDFELPDPLRTADGSTVSTPDEWKPRRAEILELFRENVYGRRPGKPEKLSFEVTQQDDKAMDGAATLKRVAVRSKHEGRKHQFELILFVPNERTGP